MKVQEVPLGTELLNENQRRSITVTLRLLEERLAQLEYLMTVNERGILYERVANFPHNQLKQMRARIGEIRHVIQELVFEFGLEHEVEDPARRMGALLSVTWENLEEMHANYLKAYGSVNPELAARLNPQADELTRLTLALQREVWGAGETETLSSEGDI